MAPTILLSCGMALLISGACAPSSPQTTSPKQPPAPEAAQPAQPNAAQPAQPPAPGAAGATQPSSAQPPAPGAAKPSQQAPVAQPHPFHLDVPGDSPIEVVLGPSDSREAIIYLHGVCGDPHAFGSWAAAAAKHATLISLRGDDKCDKRPGRFRWTYNYDRHNRRIDKALDAVDKLRAAARDSTLPVDLRRDRITLIGYSQGAKRVEFLAARFPQRFSHVAIIAIASEPSALRLHKTERVLLMAGAKDARQHIKDGYDKLRKAGRDARYLELPDARHGEYGPDANEVMEKGLDWLFKKVP